MKSVVAFLAASGLASLGGGVNAESARPLGCNTRLSIAGITSPQDFSGTIEWLYDGEVYNQYQEVRSSDWDWNLNIELERPEFVCAVSYHTEWWAQCPSHGTISTSTDSGATYTPKANFTGTFIAQLVGTSPTPEHMNTFALDGAGANAVQLTIQGSHSAEARLREVSVWTYD